MLSQLLPNHDTSQNLLRNLDPSSVALRSISLPSLICKPNQSHPSHIHNTSHYSASSSFILPAASRSSQQPIQSFIGTPSYHQANQPTIHPAIHLITH